MNRRILLSVLAIMVSVSVVFAGGSKEVSEKSLGPENSWTESFDINNRSGKYNAYVTATDLAHNEGIAGPFNIVIDEESDLPVVSITNPAPNMSVPGNLNIVGSCVDDDKVEAVYLILDGDKSNPVLVEGTDFWSYYLDTNDLKEGPHTIEAYGVDNGNPNAYVKEDGSIDEARVKPKTGHSKFVTWQLNRHAPETKVTNMDMGSLVSGKITVNGEVTDGNGVDTLEYSVDGGVHYTPIKFKKNKLSTPDEDGNTVINTFSITLDTKKMPDGPTLCWFKAIDSTGSVGITSFLYFIDNAGPDVKVVSPAPGETVNGMFTLAGYAKDKIGIKSLKYSWGKTSGEFELIPGNPYWALELDSREVSSTKDFVITAEDIMGNVVTVTHRFVNNEKGNHKESGVVWVNQDGDKPVVEIKYPVGEVNGEDGALFIRGLATDDDGVSTVFYQLDGGEEHRIDATGVFYAPIPGSLSNGEHKISAWAVDRNGIVGDKTTSTFSSKGIAPEFKNAKYKGKDFTNAMPINPEEGGEFSVDVTSSTGLKTVRYEWIWNSDRKVVDVPVEEGAKSIPIKISFAGDDVPWGISKFNITATDKFDREASTGYILNVLDLTGVHSQEAGVFFTDTAVSSDGCVLANPSNAVTGYFVGGKIASVKTVPTVRGVTATAQDNTIVVSAPAETSKFAVQVTTTSGAVYTSRQIFFPSKEGAPKITINDQSLATEVFNNFNSRNTLSITGSVESSSTAEVRYRILTAQVNYDENGVVVSSQALPVPKLAESTTVPLRRNSFTLNFTSENFVDGISIVEIIASNASGKLSSTAVLVRKINNPVSQNLDGSPAKQPANPATYWLHGDGEGMDYYGVCVFQGDTASIFSFKDYDDIPEGNSTLEFKGVKLNVKKDATAITGTYSTVDANPYRSGMKVLMLKDGTLETDPHVITVRINSGVPVTEVKWTANGKSITAGEIRDLGGGVYEADASLSGLPAGFTTITANVNGKSAISGAINVVRAHSVVDNTEGIYWTMAGGAVYDPSTGNYVVDNGAELIGYANVPGTIRASMARAVSGVSVTSEDKLVKLTATSDGTFRNVTVRVQNDANGSWNSTGVTLVADTSAPIIDVTGVKAMDYVKDRIALSGTVSDGNGVRTLEYKTVEEDTITTADGNTVSAWKALPFNSRGAFNTTINLTDSPDGYLPLTIRATDTTGKISYYNSALKKDTTPPEIKVIVPEAGAKVNGETLFVFSVKDDSYVGQIQYQGNKGRIKQDFDIVSNAQASISDATVEEVEGEAAAADAASSPSIVKTSMAPSDSTVMKGALPSAHFGQPSRPISNDMKFVAKDGAGNVATLDKYEFSVDPDSDLPVVEIHMPLEDSVITTDFVITGVMYDDDGMHSADGTKICKTYYKVDNSAYQMIDNPDGLSSFEIVVKPLSKLTDNEHTVTIYAEDINGVKGREVQRKFKVSLEEPKGGVLTPKLDESVKGMVKLTGWAQDKNGINRVQISVDNGASYNEAVVIPGRNREDRAQWSYEFDTRVIQDGSHVVFLKIWDGYDITGLFTSLINVDNTPPIMELEYPIDDSTISSNLFISGQTMDNIALETLFVKIRSLDGKRVPDYLALNDLEPDSIISQVIDISELPNGLYNIEITGSDYAGNSTNISRNVTLKKDVELTKVDLLYPLNGEHVQGEFNIYGLGTSQDDKIVKLEILVDGQKLPGFQTELTETGYFSFRLKDEIKLNKEDFTEAETQKGINDAQKREANNLRIKEQTEARNAALKAKIEADKAAAKEAGKPYEGPEYKDVEEKPVYEDEGMYESGIFKLKEGNHTYQIVATTEKGRTITSREQTLIYNPYGPWVTLDNFTYGDFAIKRPLLKGNAGYALTPEEKETLKNKNTPTEEKLALKAKTVKKVWLSLDNGKTYQEVSKDGKGAWKYRIENQDVAEGYHFLLVRAEMENGENAITRTIVQVDRTLPEVKLISPGAGGHYNQMLKFEGLSSDDVELKDVTLYLRKGDKSSYEIPKFIQGLYFDASFWGASLWSVGVGVTAFDDAVKLELHYGQFTQGQRDAVNNIIGRGYSNLRYGGHIAGFKIIAQVGYIPFNYFFGHDFDWLTATISVGADFSYFSESGAGTRQILSAALMQIEFPRMTFENMKYFKTWSLYWEPQVWFISSDVSTTIDKIIVPTMSIGIRTSVF